MFCCCCSLPFSFSSTGSNNSNKTGPPFAALRTSGGTEARVGERPEGSRECSHVPQILTSSRLPPTTLFISPHGRARSWPLWPKAGPIARSPSPLITFSPHHVHRLLRVNQHPAGDEDDHASDDDAHRGQPGRSRPRLASARPALGPDAGTAPMPPGRSQRRPGAELPRWPGRPTPACGGSRSCFISMTSSPSSVSQTRRGSLIVSLRQAIHKKCRPTPMMTKPLARSMTGDQRPRDCNCLSAPAPA